MMFYVLFYMLPQLDNSSYHHRRSLSLTLDKITIHPILLKPSVDSIGRVTTGPG